MELVADDDTIENQVKALHADLDLADESEQDDDDVDWEPDMGSASGYFGPLAAEEEIDEYVRPKATV